MPNFSVGGVEVRKYFLLLIIPFLFLGCGTAPKKGAPSQAGFPIAIPDAFGKDFELARPPQRIVSLAPSHTEILFALGLADRIVGVTEWCNYPPEAETKPKVGDLNLNFEKIVSLKPDLVVGIRSMQEDALLRLQKLGLKVLALEPQGIDGTLEAIETLGLVTGKKAEADQLKAKIQGQLAGVKQLKPKPKVLLVLDLDPLYTVGPGSLQHELLERAGGENIAEDADNPWPQLDEEVVIAKDPDLILVTADQKARILAKPAWRHIAAVKEKRIYAVDPDLISRPGPRLGIAVRELARVMSK